MHTPSSNQPVSHCFAPVRLGVWRFNFEKKCLQKLVVLLVLAFFLSSCHKKKEDVSTPQPVPEATVNASNQDTSTQAISSSPAGPVNPILPTSEVLKDPAVHANLQALNMRLYQYLSQTHQMPVSFDAFANATGIEIPPPPAGMRYVIYNASVTLGPK